MRIRRLSDSKDAARVQRHLARLVEEARARGDEAITFDVERIYREVQLSTEDGYMVCCDILDSERFARAH